MGRTETELTGLLAKSIAPSYKNEERMRMLIV